MTNRRLSLGILLAVLAASRAQAAPPAVKLVRRDADRRIDVLVDGKPFTSYIWPERSKKPSLFPIRSATGTIITRGFPLEPRAKEATDHPHHIGLWFNYGDVDGIDFWSHSDATPENNLSKMGTIFHRAVKQATGGAGHGKLLVTNDWVKADGKTVIKETTAYAFAAGDGRRAIDRIATLTAVDGPVRFPDNKEGALGLRVARGLEMPSKKGDNEGVTGNYTSSEGVTGEAAWGTRARWMMLTGTVDGEAVTVAMLDHPRNPGHPTYWHARGYGLFAANPFAQKVMSEGKEELNFQIGKGKSARFAWRTVILAGTARPEDVEAEWKKFGSEVK